MPSYEQLGKGKSNQQKIIVIIAIIVVIVLSSVLLAVIFKKDKVGEVEPFALLNELINIESISGSEEEMGEFLDSWLKSRKWIVTRQNVQGDTFNVFAHRGNPNPRLIVNSHMDTVPPFIPFSEDEENIYGRGACDAKGSIVAQLVAITQLLEEGKLDPNDIGLLYVVQEETTSAGMKKANELGLTPQYLLVGEPTEGFLAEGHKGGVSFDLQITGKSSHSGYPELGISAVVPMLDILQDLEKNVWPVDPIFGPSTLNIGLVDCGVARNVVPESCNSSVLIRASIEAEKIKEEVELIVNNRANLTFFSVYSPFKCDVLPGFESKVFNYGTDLPSFEGNHKSYLFGPGTILVAHTPAEKMIKSDLINGISEYKRLIMAILEQS